jgi:hypothetical protein
MSGSIDQPRVRRGDYHCVDSFEGLATHYVSTVSDGRIVLVDGPYGNRPAALRAAWDLNKASGMAIAGLEPAA